MYFKRHRVGGELLANIGWLLPKGRLRLLLFILAAAIAVVMALGYREYRRQKSSMVAAHRMHNQLVAKYVAEELRADIEALGGLLPAAAEVGEQASGSIPFTPALCAMLGGGPASDAWVVDKRGALLFSCSGRMANSDDLSRHPAFSRARGIAPGRVEGAGVTIGPREATYFAALASDGAVALFAVPVPSLIERILSRVREIHATTIWVMDSEGTLLYHNLHPEMFGRNIFKDKSECQQCHESFLPQRSMLEMASGAQNYQVKGRSNVAGFSVATMLGERWTVVASEPMEDIVAAWRMGTWWVVTTLLLVSCLVATVVSSVANRRRDMIFYKQMAHTEKLAALGKLAAGSAHEVLNPLNIISMLVQMRKMEEGLDEQEVEMLDTLLRQVHRIDAHISSMRKFSRQEELGEFQLLEVRGLVEESSALALVGYRGKEVEVVKTFSDYLPAVAGDRASLIEAMVNIIVNAYDALDGEGSLEIAAYPEGEGVCISFSDTGPGIPKEILGKVFDPFFTTKGLDKGTGLGLSVALAIVESHGGKISVESREGEGSTFSVWLPARV